MMSAAESDPPWKQLRGLSRLLFSFRVAFQGIATALRTQQNFRIHLLAALTVIMASTILRVSLAQWLILMACMGGVLSAELLNTAIEQLVDLICPEPDQRAGAIKDLSAGAVLIVCLTAAMIGAAILGPALYSGLCEQ